MIPQDFIDYLLSRVDIVDVVERYVPLKKGGQNYLACCPFHKEKTPSFTVSSTKQFYHCFGCGAHGSAIGFVMEYQALDFIAAVQLLAQSIGIEVPVALRPHSKRAQEAPRPQQFPLEEVLSEAAAYYQQQLKLSPDAIDYCKKRGITGDTAAYFGLGYAPDDWQALAVPFSNYRDKRLLESGLVIVPDAGGRYDRFRHRLMFPIRNQRGTIIGFGGRVLGSGTTPKYLNSPETPLFEKGSELYGLYEARQAIRQKNRVVVVEGYMDVLTLAQSGIDYAVATLGTATTGEQIYKLMRYADNVYFCFDGDSAGQKAAWRALENSLPQLADGKSLYFLFLPAEHDPDSFIRSAGALAFERLLEEASLPLSMYFTRELTRRLDTTSSEGRTALIRQAAPLLAQIAAPILGFIIKKRLAELAAVSVDELDMLIGYKKSRRQGQRQYRVPAKSSRPWNTSLVYKQIKWLLMNPEWAEDIHIPDSLTLPDEMACFAMLAERAQQCRVSPTPAQLVESVRHSPFERLVNDIMQQAVQDPEEFALPDDSCRAQFRDGNAKLLQELRALELERLKHKSQSERLTPEEAKLVCVLLAR